MTIEELNVRITADAADFKKKMAEAKAAVDAFKSGAREAGDEVTKAFGGLISSEVSVTGSTVLTDSGPVKISAVPSEPVSIPSDVPSAAYAYPHSASGMRTADVLTLDSSETVIGAVSAPANEPQPVSITTTVELDGDKVGESVERFNMRQGKIGNGTGR